MTSNFEDFIRDCEQAAQNILSHIKKNGYIQIFSHMDADGVTAGSIIAKAIYRSGGNFNLRIIKHINEQLINQLLQLKCEYYLFSEIGSGYLDLLEKLSETATVLIFDHHKPVQGTYPKIIHVNPHLHGIDGATEVSGSGISYFLAKNISNENIDLAYLAIVGALGDLQDKNEHRTLHGLNQIIVDDAVKDGQLEVSTDLLFYGRETRPIHKAIASMMNPFIPGLSGEEDKCLGFLVNLGISLKQNDKWSTLADLSSEEKQKIFSQITMYLSSKGYSSSSILSLLGNVYTLLKEDKWTPLRDAREFASLLNACVKVKKAGVGLALCLGNKVESLVEAQTMLTEYRKTLAKYIGQLHASPERMVESEDICLIKCEGIVDEHLLSPITTILSISGIFNPSKPLIAMTKTEEGEVTISARANETLTSKGLNIGVVMQKAAEKVNGRGGGHNVAAGATIPLGAEENFLQAVSQLVKEMM
ncbi:MAG: DHH family phosphoesterase [Candidatus Bathyarchaeota archaeon]